MNMAVLIAIAAVTVLAVTVGSLLAVWACEGRPVLPAEPESRPVEMVL